MRALLLGVLTLALASSACGGASSTTSGQRSGEPAASAAGAPREVLPVTAGTPYLTVLGIAQDGGVPQAGSEHPAWSDPSLRRRVVSVALVDPRGAGARYLFEATPDFREQLHELGKLQPARAGGPVLDGVFLTHGHMGHYTGLMFLGHESMGASAVPVYAMPRMASYLSTNGPWDQLVRYRNVELEPLEAGVAVSLGDGLAVTPIAVPHRQEYTEVVGFSIAGPERAVLFVPDIDSFAALDQWGVRIEDLIASVDVAYLDGSFWAQGEIPGRDMTEFPHPMITDSLERFAPLPAAERAKIRFIHLNHTNPALDPSGPERTRIEAAGFAVAEEGERVGL